MSTPGCVVVTCTPNLSHGMFRCYCRVVTEEDLAAVVAQVDRAEANGGIAVPDTLTDCPTSVIPAGKEPQPGSIVSRCEIKVLTGNHDSDRP